jgi:hypothetical protein
VDGRYDATAGRSGQDQRRQAALSRLAKKGVRVTQSPALGDAVIVTESGAGPYGQVITAGGHQLTADEPADVGGADVGGADVHITTTEN